MKILITGSNGQLGSEIKELSKNYQSWNFIFTDIGELDITNPEALEEFFNAENFDFIINCAAYTAVDKAESDEKTAELINTEAVRNLAVISKKAGAKLIHLSTDFVFDGTKSLPYAETDIPNPLSIYGKTKLEGEREANKFCPGTVIIRTSWLYSQYGGNFVRNIIRLAKERNKLTMIFDQIGTPTYARDLAKTILGNIDQLININGGIYHYSNEGVASWYDFAKAICEFSEIKCGIIPIETKDYPTPAKRPGYSVLNKAKIKLDLGIEIPYWRDSLKECIEKMKLK